MAYASKTMMTAFASAIAALLITQSATAVTPTAVWVKNLGQSYTIDGKTYAVTLRNGTLNQDGTITVSSTWGHAAPYIDMDGKGIGTISILVKYSGLDINQVYNADALSIGVAFSSIVDSDTNVVGSCVQKVNGVANNTVRAYHCAVSATSATPRDIGNMTAVEGTGYLLFSYKDSEGSRTYMGTSIAELTGGQDTAGHWSGRTLKKIVLGGDESGKAFNGAGFKIEEVALFVNEYYTASDVASYEFPAKIYSSDVNVSTINNDFSGASEIDVYLANDVTVTGDTTFTATKVNFHCYGSFNITPPANNEATFDFSGVAGSPVIKYTGFFPAVSGTTFTSNSIPTSVSDASSWKGTVWVRGAKMVALNPDTYGNGSSTLRLSGCQGHFAQGSINCNVAIELLNDGYQYGINVDNGFSRASNTPNNKVVINTLKGTGAVWTSGSADTVLINVRDWSKFTGPLQFVNKILVLGEDIPAIDDFNVAGSIYICAGATLTATSQLRADRGIYVNGVLSTPNVNTTTYIRDGTTIRVSDTGVLEITRSDSSSNDDGGTDYSKVTGTGTIRFAGEGFTVISQSIPTALTFAAEKANGSVVPIAGATIGSLTGNKGFRSDWGNNGEGGRYLTIKQSTDTVWDGSICVGGAHRLTGVVVDPGANSTGTLTMTATQTATSTLTVNGSVNLTGTWVGATTVAGTLGGTGAITGDVTLSDGATLKVGDMNDTLTVSGSLTATGAITIELPEGAEKGMVITTGSKPDITGATFTVKVGNEIKRSYNVEATDDGLKVLSGGFVLLFR